MSVNAVSGAAQTTYSGYESGFVMAPGVEAKETSGEVAAVYEKSDTQKNATYSVNKMSAEDRAALVSQLKADQESRENNFLNMVHQMISGQAKTFAIGMDSQDMWRFLASGQFEVDPATKAQAQADIAEDGYWGVSQTSQRLFDFASALSGGNVETMKKMQEAMMKGFEQATSTWGKELPEISQKTIDAANKLFDDYYASMGTTV